MNWCLSGAEFYPYFFWIGDGGDIFQSFRKATKSLKVNGGNELQSGEFSHGSGLDLYDATFRMYDAQIGMFHQVDSWADITEDWSLYSFAFDNPVSFNDPLGLTSDTTVLEKVIVTPSGRDPMSAICMTCSLPALILRKL